VIGRILVIAASAGGLEAMRQIVAALPVPCRAAVFIAWHIGPNSSVLPAILARASGSPAIHPRHGYTIEAGHIYVAPPDHHMRLGAGIIRLDRSPKVHHTRPAADPLFLSAAEVYGPRVIGIVLSGGATDGAAGLRSIKERGGIALVQRPESAEVPFMPRAAIEAGNPDAVLSILEIAQRVSRLCSGDGTHPSGLR
jgi:two-component system chemotaxis response regulator CheB